MRYKYATELRAVRHLLMIVCVLFVLSLCVQGIAWLARLVS
jgi:hypothetical protein